MPTISPERIGIDVGRKLPLEAAVDWAAGNDVGIIDIQLDTGANVVTSFDNARAHAIRRSCDHHDIRLGLHTLSAVNVAEYAPLVGEAVDAYLKAYIDAASLLGAEWIVVHAGFHFSADISLRMQAGLDRLNRAADYAAAKSVLLLLENLNKEPPDAEVHYLAHTVDGWRCNSRSPPITPIWCRKESRASSMPSPCGGSARFALPTAAGLAARNISIPVKVISIFRRCSGRWNRVATTVTT
jgi:Xylose isomerase-like TIM barrel